MFAVNNVSIQFSGEVLFENVTFNINARDRIGLVGRNGAGKTTLMRIIAGMMEAKTGSFTQPAGTSIGFLQQEMEIGSSRTVFDEAMTAFEEASRLEVEIKELGDEISYRTDVHSQAYLKLINRLHEANERYHIIGGQNREENIGKVLLGLGFLQQDFHRPLNEFSGGWQMRVELAKILLQWPDLLLLDEPTNHLDIESIQWLEEFLGDYPGAVILVSHDRALLDNVTKRTIELSLGKSYDYKYSYSGYVIKREEEKSTQKAAFNNQQQQIAQIERFIERFRYKATKSRQVQSRIKLLEKMDVVEIEDVDTSAIHFSFPPAPPSGKVVVEAVDLGKSFGHHLVLEDLNFAIIKDDFVAFVGKNGMGKTTLSRIIVGDLEHNGKIKLGHNVKIGYFAQNQAEMLDLEKTVFQTIDDVAVGDIRPKVRAILGSFLFGGDTIDKKVKILSGGEKSRLALARMLLTPVNLLVLDEPTNHLDMTSKDILKNALLRYDGTCIIVSHDRDFLQGLTNKVFEFRNHGIRQYLGDVYDFLSSRKLESLRELERKEKNSQTVDNENPQSANRQNYEKKKLFNKELRKVSNQIKRCEDEIGRMETEIRMLDDILTHPDQHPGAINDHKIYDKYKDLKEKLELHMLRWEELHLLYEEMKKNQQA